MCKHTIKLRAGEKISPLILRVYLNFEKCDYLPLAINGEICTKKPLHLALQSYLQLVDARFVSNEIKRYPINLNKGCLY